MRVVFAGRSVVCLGGMSPAVLDLPAMEGAAGLARPATQVINPQLAVADYERFRILVTPDGRAQAEFALNASKELCRAVAGELIRQASAFGLRGTGFNGMARIDADDDEQPVGGLVNRDAVEGFLQATPLRIGAKIVYASDDAARITVDIAPIDDEPNVWLATLNRHYDGILDADALARGISWLAALNDELPSLLRRLPGATANA